MKYLQLALYAEGATDEYFLSPLLQRMCEELCAAHGTEPVEVSGVLGLRHAESISTEPRHDRILACAREAEDAWNVLFVHSDGDGSPRTARQQRVQPAINLVMQEYPARQAVAVVPLRETEAWGICDGDALREVFGTTFSNQAMGVPDPPHNAETILDPKRILEGAFTLTRPTAQRRRRGVSPLLGALGQQVSLNTLRRVPAFRTFETELTDALRFQRFIA
jgi:hypothetical protein